MIIAHTANAARPARTTARASAALLPFAITSHLVLDNDTGRVVGTQRSLQMQGRTFSTAVAPVL